MAVTPCVGVWIEIFQTVRDTGEKRSLPAWECGLKYKRIKLCACSDSVTPCVGVWIEINITRLKEKRSERVTPCVGVWIEMTPLQAFDHKGKSLPAWECGLKYCILQVFQRPISVTPCVGVWIEISKKSRISLWNSMSLPAWECGLKFKVCLILVLQFPSLPAWECGLKFLVNIIPFAKCYVTPCVGVWIEMNMPFAVDRYPTGHSLRGSVD